MTVSHLWCAHKVHLKQSCLEWTFLGLVSFQSFQEEGRTLGNQVLFHEDIGYLKWKLSLQTIDDTPAGSDNNSVKSSLGIWYGRIITLNSHVPPPPPPNKTTFPHTFNVRKRWIILNEHGCECSAIFHVAPHHVTQDEDVIWRVVHLLGIQNYLLELVCLSKTDDDLGIWRNKNNRYLLLICVANYICCL